MCIIVVKPSGKQMPNKKILRHCWDNNDDGAGYMFPDGKQVYIKKGFMSFDRFYSNLMQDYKKAGALTPFVLHFRISTQGGVNEQCTHPFPLSREMDDLKKTKTTCEIGIAHNGVISLTKSGYMVNVTYSDTMKFITDYASLIIKDKHFYKDKDIVTLLDRLVGGRLAILDNEGHIQLIGDFKEKDGIYYSNNTFEEDRVKKTTINVCKSSCEGCKGKCKSDKKEDKDAGEETKRLIFDQTKYISAISRPEQIKEPPSFDDLAKMDETTRGLYLDRYYETRSKAPYEYDFKEDCCPMYYENEMAYCYMCKNLDLCEFHKKVRSLKDELEY